MSAAIATPLVNGFTPLLPTTVNEAAEYERILKLRDEVFAGIHPRLTVPAHAIRKVSPLPTTQPASASHTNVPPPFSAPPPQSQLPGLSLNDEDMGQSQSTQSSTESATMTQPKPTASGIDPVLLTKSDDLVRAETQIHRQRLEKALRDQFEQKRLDARKKPAPGEAKPDFDVNAVLAKALEVAKPESVTKVSSPGEDVSASESYDENSLYSSRGPDSTPEVGELEDSTSQINQISFVESSAANGTADAQVGLSQNVPSADLPRQGNSKGGPDHTTSPNTHAYPVPNRRPHPSAVDLTTEDNDDDEEEGEYSPPEAVEQAATPQEPGSYAIDPRSRPLRRYSELGETGVRAGSPNGSNMRIVRNHITSPIAPQPSRVSPLAVAKQPLISQNHRGRNGRVQRGRDESPDAAGQTMPPKKKRKLDKKAERRRRMGRGSPDIKDEPVSPPPFHDVQPLGSGKLRPAVDERPIVLDDIQPREVRYVQAPNTYLDSPTRPMSRHAGPMMPLSEPRVMSRASIRLPQEPDLRRVASMHNMRDMQPREYIEPIYETPMRARAPSYIHADSPMRMEPTRLVPDSPMSYDRVVSQGMTISRTPAPTYREVYQQPEPQIRYVHEAMPPPVVERIVVDADGRKYREIIETRDSTAVPRAASNYIEREAPDYYDSYGRVRAGSVFVEAAPDVRYAQEMPPPRIGRQVADPGPVRREAYDPMPVGRGTSIAPVDRAPRQVVYVDDRVEYREPVRMGSIRPPPSRYEEQPLNQPSRVAGVRPTVRQGSVFMEDRLPSRPDYAPMGTPQYQVMERPGRYVDAQGREIIMDGAPDVGQRYVQRY